MRKARLGLLLTALAVIACGPAEKRPEQKSMQEGRTYTAWLYGSEYKKLWDRFSPDMRQAFGSVTDLADFAVARSRIWGTSRAT